MAMETTLVWIEGFQFNSYFRGGAFFSNPALKTSPHPELGNLVVPMDAKPPSGTHSAPTPKEIVLAGLLGCSAMDVVSLLKKWKEPLESLKVTSTADQTEAGHPTVFKTIHVNYFFEGELNPEKALESVKLSQTKYCGVSAMIAKTADIHYTVFVNETLVGEGKSDFSGNL